MENNRLEFADALRGYAILLVMAVHCWIYLNPLNSPEWLKTIFINGGFGVQLFFIASAFTLFYSLTYAHNQQDGWLAFFIRRIFRIVPMFYIAIIVYSIILSNNLFYVVGVSSGDAFTANILEHVAFLFAFDPIHVNTLVPGGWSIATEMMFYLTIPLIFTYVKRTSHICGLLLASIIANIGLQLYIVNTEIVNVNPMYFFWWLPNQFAVFCMGILLFMLLKDIIFNDNVISKLSELQKKCIGLVGLTSSTGIIYYALFIYARNPTGMITLYAISVAFMIFAASIAIYPFKLLVNKWITTVGKVSYSCYLLHFIVVSIIGAIVLNIIPDVSTEVIILTYAIVVNITIIISHFTYTYIEQPGISMGKQLIKKLKGEQT